MTLLSAPHGCSHMPSSSVAKLRLALVLGQPQSSHLHNRVTHWAQRQLNDHHDLIVDTIDLRRWVPISTEIPAQPELKARLEGADAFLIMLATETIPLGAFSALSGLLHRFALAWQAKPVGFIAYGGGNEEYSILDQLRLLLATQHVMPVGNPVSFAYAYERFGLQGQLYASLGEPQRLTLLLARLKWWAHALRQARLAMPYDQVGFVPPSLTS